MCKVVLADHAGFCFGVRRAIDKAYKKYDNNVYTYGSLIHNAEVMKDLNELGVKKIEDIEEFESLKKGTVIIRSHGITQAEEEKLKNTGHDIVDTTCPYVKKIHKLVYKHSSSGDIIIIFGDSKHPEVKGIVGRCVTKPIVISEEYEIDELNFEKSLSYVIVAQTTFNLAKFHTMVEKINEKVYNVSVLDTICNATEERQLATEKLAKVSDVMIVIGDKSSSNTQKLYDISRSSCKDTYFIQTASDLNFEKLVGKKLVGVTAGASTPKKIIEEVMRKCQKILDKC